MSNRKEWFCGNKIQDEETNEVRECGARLKIRAKTDRGHGPSNFAGVYPDGHPEERLRGHSIVPSGLLNWEGLAEERGWKIRPQVICPACQLGMTVEMYKETRRALRDQ